MVWKKVKSQIWKRPTEGQAMIEFILGLMMVISFFFFYVKLAAVFAVGNYIHYATFMAARAYQSSAADQTDNADKVMVSMIGGRWKHLIKATGGNSTVKGATIGPGTFYGDNPFLCSWNQGVTFHFQSSVSLYPWDKAAPPIKLDLTSESWAGREQNTAECNATKGKVQGNLNGAVAYWDNGPGGC